MQVVNPIIYAIAGCPAAGKTSYRVSALNQGMLPSTAFIHECDAVMEGLPGYQQQLASDGSVIAFKHWELPAREIAERQLQEQILAKKDIIYDHSCALPGSYDLMAGLVKEHGYKLIMHLLYVDITEAKKRAQLREQQSGRHTPEHLITDRMKMLSTLWPRYLNLATEAYLLNNSFDSPIEIASYKDQKLEIHDPVTYKNFIAVYE